jgi:nucleotide-binding universal stress UspA family protein
MYEIILGIDDSERRAIAQAETVVGLPNAAETVHATLFHDFTENPTGASVHQVASVRRASDHLGEAGVAVTLEESSGDPAREILALADERDADLVCLAGRKRTPASKAVFGSVTQEVILNANRPVLVCSPGQADDSE